MFDAINEQLVSQTEALQEDEKRGTEAAAAALESEPSAVPANTGTTPKGKEAKAESAGGPDLGKATFLNNSLCSPMLSTLLSLIIAICIFLPIWKFCTWCGEVGSISCFKTDTKLVYIST